MPLSPVVVVTVVVVVVKVVRVVEVMIVRDNVDSTCNMNLMSCDFAHDMSLDIANIFIITDRL